MNDVNKNILNSKPKFDTRVCRAKDLLIRFSKQYAGLWQLMDSDREAYIEKNESPSWSFTSQVVSAGSFNSFVNPNQLTLLQLPQHLVTNALISHFLYSWRATQGVYRVDTELLNEIVSTELLGSIPSEVLVKMPEWCIYVETPNLEFTPANSILETNKAHGFFALLDPDRETGEPWLSVFIDGFEAYEMATIKLSPRLSISECVSATIEIIRKRNPSHPISPTQERNMSRLMEPFLNILLFICSQASEIGDGHSKPKLPEPVKTKRGIRYFPPNEPKIWDVGVRIGAALKLARHSTSNDSSDSNRSVRPHIRRAHWHGYWHGRLSEERYFKLKWIPPVAVKVENVDNLPAVIRGVQ